MSYRLGTGVGLEKSDGSIYLAPLPAGPILVLEGIAALIFTEATSDDRRSLEDRIIDQVDSTPDEIAAYIAAFLNDLVARGLLIEDSG